MAMQCYYMSRVRQTRLNSTQLTSFEKSVIRERRSEVAHASLRADLGAPLCHVVARVERFLQMASADRDGILHQRRLRLSQQGIEGWHVSATRYL